MTDTRVPREIVDGPFSEFADGARAVIHYRPMDDGPQVSVSHITLERGGLVLFDSRRDADTMLRVFKHTREWRLEKRTSPDAIMKVG